MIHPPAIWPVTNQACLFRSTPPRIRARLRPRHKAAPCLGRLAAVARGHALLISLSQLGIRLKPAAEKVDAANDSGSAGLQSLCRRSNCDFAG